VELKDRVARVVLAIRVAERRRTINSYELIPRSGDTTGCWYRWRMEALGKYFGIEFEFSFRLFSPKKLKVWNLKVKKTVYCAPVLCITGEGFRASESGYHK
jgi:hypothetical protein